MSDRISSSFLQQTAPPTRHQTVQLQAKKYLRLAHPRGQRVEACNGTVWVTVDGQAQDIVLEPGQSHRFETDAPALLGSLDGSARAWLSQAAQADTAVGAAPEAEPWLSAQVEAWLGSKAQALSTLR